jgi:hypothetical protein
MWSSGPTKDDFLPWRQLCSHGCCCTVYRLAGGGTQCVQTTVILRLSNMIPAHLPRDKGSGVMAKAKMVGGYQMTRPPRGQWSWSALSILNSPHEPPRNKFDHSHPARLKSLAPSTPPPADIYLVTGHSAINLVPASPP